jgi:hypothetical protein
MGWGVGIMQMEEALIRQKYGVKVTNHMDPISYGK